ncbi:hypothetical protein ABKN59_003777 [Abortiporus biennis]
MSSNKSGSSKSKKSSGSRAKSSSDGKPSKYSIYKSYGGWPNFMHSHGLKTWDHDDVEEGNRIVEARCISIDHRTGVADMYYVRERRKCVRIFVTQGSTMLRPYLRIQYAFLKRMPFFREARVRATSS